MELYPHCPHQHKSKPLQRRYDGIWCDLPHMIPCNAYLVLSQFTGVACISSAVSRLCGSESSCCCTEWLCPTVSIFRPPVSAERNLRWATDRRLWFSSDVFSQKRRGCAVARSSGHCGFSCLFGRSSACRAWFSGSTAACFAASCGSVVESLRSQMCALPAIKPCFSSLRKKRAAEGILQESVLVFCRVKPGCSVAVHLHLPAG